MKRYVKFYKGINKTEDEVYGTSDNNSNYKPRYAVYSGLINYEGELYDKTLVAKFYHPNRAEEYADYYNKKEAADSSVFYERHTP